MHTAKEICEKLNDRRQPSRERTVGLLKSCRFGSTSTPMFMVEGDLRREVAVNVKRLMDLGCYRGLRHRRGPARPRSAHSYERPYPQGPGEVRSPVRRSNTASGRASGAPQPAVKERRRWLATSSAPAARERKNISSGVCACERVVQQHDDHHRGRPGQRDFVVVRRAHGLQGIAEVDALCCSGRRRGRWPQGAGTRHAHA